MLHDPLFSVSSSNSVTPNRIIVKMSDTKLSDELIKPTNDAATEELAGQPQTKPVSRFTRWYRSPLFNVIIVGLISFTQPGIWNALNSTGAGGQQEPYLVNGANSLTFGIMVFGCSIFAILANKIGIKWVLLLGTLGYAPYSASLYVNNRYGVEWFVLFGGATCGLAASALWASEGAIALGYGDVKDRGKFTGIWLGLRELGQLIGAGIQLSLNYKNGQTGKVSYTTYLVLIGLQCLGLPLALLISSPEKVITGTGRVVNDPTKQKAVLGEAKRWWALIKRKEMFMLIPVLMGFNWNGTYLGIYQTKYFSVRARTLSSLVSGIVATLANIFWGWFYDLKIFSRPTLVKITWFSFSIIMLAIFGWQVANEMKYSRSPTKVTLDWANPGFGRGFASMIMMRFFNESHYMFVYYICGAFFDDLETLTLAVGIVRSFESVGSCLSFGIGAAQVKPIVNLGIAFAMFAITIPATSYVVFLVPERPVDLSKTLRDDASGSVDTAVDEGADDGGDPNPKNAPLEVSKVAGAIDATRP
ncbi:major facilitator superfamily domain-containing protein [Coniochaeta sp. 2T2.1]|nr:major facilitator superfamily domain-containing protein [Coniochaeta sp. 2T2.1]